MTDYGSVEGERNENILCNLGGARSHHSPFAMQEKLQSSHPSYEKPKGNIVLLFVLAITCTSTVCDTVGNQTVINPGGLEQLVFQSHVRLRLKADTCTEDVGEGTALLGQSVDDRGARRGQRGL